MNGDSVPVLIIGGGPVGLTLAIDLSWRGIPSLLVDCGSREDRAKHPRMDQVSLRSMEHIRRWGELDQIISAGFPRDTCRDIVFVTGVLGFELQREPMEADATRSPPPFSPQIHELCPQNFFDPALQKIAGRAPLADIQYGVRLCGFTETPDGISAQLEYLNTGTQFEVQANYLAACDGANSFVARELGIGSDRASLIAQSANIFFRSPELTARARAPGLSLHPPGRGRCLGVRSQYGRTGHVAAAGSGRNGIAQLV